MPAINPTLTNVSKTKRPDALSFDYLTAFTFGPKDVADSSAGPYNRPWRVRATTVGEVWIARANDTNDAWLPETLLFSYGGAAIEEVDIAFEQAARPVVVAQILGNVWIYKYDPFTAMFTFTNVGPGRNVRCALDNPLDSSSSDVMVFYVNDTAGFLCYRAQKDRYAVEYVSSLPTNLDYYLEEMAFSRDNRMQIWYVQRNEATGRYDRKQLQSVLYPYPTTFDAATFAGQVESGILKLVLIVALIDYDSFRLAGSIQSGILSIPLFIQNMDFESIQFSGLIQSGLLALAIITQAMDHDDLKLAGLIQSGTMPVIVIVHNLYDHDDVKFGGLIQSGTLA